ncbi:RNA polymerase sigma factor [Paenibacillus medicaginis]|uniref:RNA polymerase sigma factor n=1 Tax=Paenibacillus medicaginis TaxID=1470560 RepID=A0ABV5C206_9BACL
MEKLDRSTENGDSEITSVLVEVQRGDKAAYTFIIAKFQKQIFLYCYYLLKNVEEAEDAAQDIFIKGLVRIDQYVHTGSFSAWLYKIAYHHCLDLIKKKKKSFNLLLEYRKKKEQEKEVGYTDIIHECLDRLNIEERQILLLRSLEEYTYDEIASIMDLKSSTVRKKFERLRKKLIKEMGKGEEFYEHSF